MKVHLSRLARNAMDQAQTDALLNKLGITLVSIDDPLTDDSAVGNLLGCRGLWAAVAVLGTVCSLTYAVYKNAPLVNPGSVIGGISFIAATYIGWSILPAATKRAADNYAESAWMAFLHLGDAGTGRGTKKAKQSRKQGEKNARLE